MAYLRTAWVLGLAGGGLAPGPAAIYILAPVHVDTAAQHHYSAADVNGLLAQNGLAIVHLWHLYPAAPWGMVGGEYNVTVMAGGRRMIFKWANPGVAAPALARFSTMWLFHIDMDQARKQKELLARFNAVEVKEDPFAAEAVAARSAGAKSSAGSVVVRGGKVVKA